MGQLVCWLFDWPGWKLGWGVLDCGVCQGNEEVELEQLQNQNP